MPLYLYKCESCKHVTEALRRMSDRDKVNVCEECGGKAPRTTHGQTPQGFWFGPPKHLKHRVERTAHNINERQEGRRKVETNDPTIPKQTTAL